MHQPHRMAPTALYSEGKTLLAATMPTPPTAPMAPATSACLGPRGERKMARSYDYAARAASILQQRLHSEPLTAPSAQ